MHANMTLAELINVLRQTNGDVRSRTLAFLGGPPRSEVVNFLRVMGLTCIRKRAAVLTAGLEKTIAELQKLQRVYGTTPLLKIIAQTKHVTGIKTIGQRPDALSSIYIQQADLDGETVYRAVFADTQQCTRWTSANPLEEQLVKQKTKRRGVVYYALANPEVLDGTRRAYLRRTG